MRVEEFRDFILAREEVRKNKEAGRKKPWTDDPIFRLFRFCNVRREDDRVTRWIAENYRVPFQDDPNVWFAMVVARLLNLPESLEAVKEAVLPKFNPAQFRRILHKRRDMGDKNFNAAYIVSTNGRPMDKVDYLILEVLTPLWARRKYLAEELPTLPLVGIHSLLGQFNGMGSFMAAQVVADLKYVPQYTGTADWHTFAASGPGSRRGLNRVLGRDKETPFGGEGSWRALLAELRAALLPKLPKGLRDLHAQDVQNCLCEFDKYERIRNNEGRPKQGYAGEKE